MEQGFACPIWLTFKQAKELGGHVKKGQKGSPVVYASKFKKEDGKGIERDIPFLKQYSVFNAEQCEGLPEHFYTTKKAPNTDIEPIEAAMTFFHSTGAK